MLSLVLWVGRTFKGIIVKKCSWCPLPRLCTDPLSPLRLFHMLVSPLPWPFVCILWQVVLPLTSSFQSSWVPIFLPTPLLALFPGVSSLIIFLHYELFSTNLQASSTIFTLTTLPSIAPWRVGGILGYSKPLGPKWNHSPPQPHPEAPCCLSLWILPWPIQSWCKKPQRHCWLHKPPPCFILSPGLLTTAGIHMSFHVSSNLSSSTISSKKP